jgi:hypothetical protein
MPARNSISGTKFDNQCEPTGFRYTPLAQGGGVKKRTINPPETPNYTLE